VSSRWIAGVVGRSRRLKCVRGDSVARFQSLSGRKRSVVESSCEEEDWRESCVGRRGEALLFCAIVRVPSVISGPFRMQLTTL
jgi:hypothetical protein